MTPQRLLAALVASVATAVMLGLIAFADVPFLAYAPGPTINVLGDTDGRPNISVTGLKTYTDDGQLRLTTVSVSRCADQGQPRGKSFVEVLQAWLSHSEAVYPYDIVCPEGQTAQQSQADGQVQMVSSQDTAKAVALRALGIKFTSGVEVLDVTPDSPADGRLQVRDFIAEVDGKKVTDNQQITDAIQAADATHPVDLVVERDHKRTSVSLTPALVDGVKRVGVSLGEGFQFPSSISLSINIDPNIGGPSAGLMFSLALYDTLTPGSLTGGGEIAGTGEIASDGTVQPIGGIQQKIVGARNAGAQLFLVPADNCVDTQGAHPGSMRLVRVTSFDSALSSIKAWSADHSADLPSCDS